MSNGSLNSQKIKAISRKFIQEPFTSRIYPGVAGWFHVTFRCINWRTLLALRPDSNNIREMGLGISSIYTYMLLLNDFHVCIANLRYPAKKNAG